MASRLSNLQASHARCRFVNQFKAYLSTELRAEVMTGSSMIVA